ncbi:MAG TPA: hypothetical protein VH500_02700, partial [Nitrososphaeraceae archaeon]
MSNTIIRNWILRHRGSLIFLVMCTIIFALVIDTSIGRLYAILYGSVFSGENFLSSVQWNTSLFILFSSVFLFGAFFVLSVIVKITKANTTNEQLHLNAIKKIAYGVQFVLSTLLLFIIFQMVFSSSYSIIVLAATICLSYSLGIIMMGYLTLRFYIWFRSNKNRVVLAYTIASMAICANLIITVVYAVYLFEGQPIIVRPHVGHMSASVSSDSPFSLMYIGSSILAFVVTWAATSLLMSHYSAKLGKTRYWIIIAMPLGYFLSQFEPFFLNTFYDLGLLDPITTSLAYYLIFGLSQVIGGILFGIALWTIGRSLSIRSVREYMNVSAYGLLLLFTTNQA